jgi:hypothetical protein
MTRQYNVEETKFGKVIWYEADGVRYSFTDNDPANSDYQAYLNKDKPKAEHFTPIVTDAD